MSPISILVIDGEVQTRKLLTTALQSNNYEVVEATTGNDGLALAAKNTPGLILLDLGLPDVSGHEVLSHLRNWYINPVIIISGQYSGKDVTRALDNGANDYLEKPFHTDELITRIKYALRKTTKERNIPVATFRNLSIDFLNRLIHKDDVPLNLTPTEYSLLTLLARNEGRVLTHQYLTREAWSKTKKNESQYLSNLITGLRKKIETDPNHPAFIVTESGVGYRFIGD